jgi:hypothetical protein
METLWKLKQNLLTHPLYSPDFYIFGRLKSDLQGMQFADAVIQTVQEWICRQPEASFEKGIRMLPERWEKCVDSGGEYTEDLTHASKCFAIMFFFFFNLSRLYLNHIAKHNL